MAPQGLNVPGVPSMGRRRGLSVPGAVGGMPAGAIGIWYADQYDSASKTIPNAVSAVALPTNLLTLPKGEFNRAYGLNGVTVVDNAVAGPDGATDASTVVGSAGDWYINLNLGAFPAGTYTYSIDMASNDGTTQSVRIGPNSSMTTVSVTPTWQTFDATIVNPSGIAFIICRNGAGAAGNIKICNARIVAGSSRGAVDTLVGHMRLGRPDIYTASSFPTVSAGELDLSVGSRYAAIQFPSDQTMTTWTVIATGKNTSMATIYSTIVAKYGGDYTNFNAAFHKGNGAPGGLNSNGSEPVFNSGIRGLWSPLTTDPYEVITNRYDGTRATFHHNESQLLYSSGASGLGTTVRDLWVGMVNSPSNVAGYKVNAIAIYPTALTNLQIEQAVAALITRAQLSSLTIATHTRVLLADGDSITFGVGATDNLGSYAHRSGVNLSPRAFGDARAIAGAVLGVSGDPSSTNSLYGRAAAVDAAIPANKKGRIYILTAMIGRNDGSGWGTGTNYANAVGAYVQARKAAGWDRVVLCTVLPSTVGGSFNTWRADVNARYRNGTFQSTYGVDAIVDFDTVTGMGADADASNTSNYGDGTHPTNAGYILLEPAYRATINGLT